MQNFIRKLIAWFAGGVPLPSPADLQAISLARSQFVNGYNDQNYSPLCEIFHEHAVFRGSVYPERWTFTRERIIVDRYMSSETCTAIKAGATAVPREGTKAVGSMTLTLTSENVTMIGGTYASDMGRFRMAVKPGYDAAPTGGPYVILWKKEKDIWQIIHMDMQP